MPVTVSRIINIIEEFAPSWLAEDWDNVGLQLGDPTNNINRILLSLDVDEHVVDEAIEQKADLIVSHHPLIFQPVKNFLLNQPFGRMTAKLIKHDISVFSAHTNLDSAAAGINDLLAKLFHLQNVDILAPTREEKLFKLVVFVPAGYEEQVRNAVCGAGAGWIGNYSYCSFSTPGEGTFLPLTGSNPFLGKQGQLETVKEQRLETIIPEKNLPRVLEEMMKSHPYEEVAYDIYPLAGKKYGLGRAGLLPVPVSLHQLTQKVKKILQVDVVRVVGDPKQKISKIALCGGAGISFLRQAKEKGAQCLVTGDLRYHEGQNAAGMGLAVIDAGHYATEAIIVSKLADLLRNAFSSKNMDIEVLESKINTNPWNYY